MKTAVIDTTLIRQGGNALPVATRSIAVEIIAFCDLCETVGSASEIGMDCTECEEGFLEKHLLIECDKGMQCDHELHHFMYDAHIGRPEEISHG